MSRLFRSHLIIAMVGLVATSCAISFGEDQQAVNIETLHHDLEELGVETLDAVPEGWHLFDRGMITETSLSYDLLDPEFNDDQPNHVIVCLSTIDGNPECEDGVDPESEPLVLELASMHHLLAWCYDAKPDCEAEALPLLARSWAADNA